MTQPPTKPLMERIERFLEIRKFPDRLLKVNAYYLSIAEKDALMAELCRFAEEVRAMENAEWDTMQEQSKQIRLGKMNPNGDIPLENCDCVTKHDWQHIAAFCAYKRILAMLGAEKDGKG